jgi:thymidylate kinase
MRMRIDDSWNSRWLSALSSILIDFEPIQILMSFLYRAVISSQLSSTLMQLLFSFDRGTRVEKTLMQTLASQLSSTLMQLLFSFDRGKRVEKTLIQTLASQISSSIVLVKLYAMIFVFSQMTRSPRHSLGPLVLRQVQVVVWRRRQ